MKILFDNIVYSLQKTGGISVVWTEIVKYLLRIPDITLECIEFDNAVENNLQRQSIDLSKINIFRRSSAYLYIKRYLDVNIYNKQKFIFHSSYYRLCSNPNAINITTVHDFTYENYTKGISKMIHCWQKYRAIKKSDYIICISESTKRDLLKFIPTIDSRKISVIYNGVSADYCLLNEEQNDSQYTKFANKSYILYVGARGAYKNFNIVVETAAKIGYPLVIVGGDLLKKEIQYIETYLSPDKYQFFSKLSNDQLNRLYNQAFALVYPSAYEGFGIPILEAQRAGCPVIAYNSSSIPEVMGRHTNMLIDHLSVDAIINKIELLNDVNMRMEIIANNFINANNFSWELTAKKTVDLYKAALKEVSR